jgi:hypothetical protein
LIRLAFTDVILLVIQICVFYTNQIPELRTFKKDPNGYFINLETDERLYWYENPYHLVNLSCASTFMSIMATVFLTYHEAEQLDENFHQHWMTSIQGGFGWIPFQKSLITYSNVVQNIDYKDIKCYIPGVSGKSADYRKFEFEFTDSSCNQLSNIFMMIRPRKDLVTQKSTFRINTSFNKVSLGNILNLINSIPKKEFHIDIPDNIDWSVYFENSLEIMEIPPQGDDRPNYELVTDQGTPVIQLCIQAENNPDQKPEFEVAMLRLLRFLLEKGFDP